MIQYAYDNNSHRVVYVEEVSKETKQDYDLRCLHCDEDIIIKDGPIKAKHFSHKSSNFGKKCTHESIYHKAAKTSLAEFINAQGLVTIMSCKCNPSPDLNHCTAQVEYPVDNGVADIAVLRDEQLVCILEIHYTHATKQRNETWFEFKAMDVLKQLRTKQTQISLQDIRPCICVLLSSSSLFSPLSYLPTTSESYPETVFLPSSYISSQLPLLSPPYFTSTVHPSVSLQTPYTPLCLQSGYPIPTQPYSTQVSHPELLLVSESERYYKHNDTSTTKAIPKVELTPAVLQHLQNVERHKYLASVSPDIPKKFINYPVEMGYYGRFDEWKDISKRITLLCLKVKKCNIREGWLPFPMAPCANWYNLYMNYRKLDKCLKCEMKFSLSFPKVYCDDCFQEVKHDDYCVIQKRIIPKEPLNQIRKYFQFIFSAPQSNGFYGQCYLCKNRTFCVWYYGYRCICIQCVTRLHDLKFPNGKYLNCEEDNLDVIVRSYLQYL